jgi:hypothetical protein
MDESVGKGPGVENEVWQSLPKLDASGVVADDFARAAGQAMTSSSADTAKDEPSQAAPEPTRDGILPRSSRLTMMAAPLAAAAALGSFAGSLTASGVTQFWPHVAPSSSSGADGLRRRPMPNLRHYPRSRHTSRALLGTPIISSPRWPIASTGSSARRPTQI